MNWNFKLKQPDDTTRDPISGEFFATEAIRDSAEALVREGVQNSLDARVPGSTVRVRIAVSEDKWAASPSAASRFLSQLHPHLTATGNGIRNDLRPDPQQPVKFLTYEDFGTTGLIGDPLQWHRIEGEQNGFFAFFRAEGENAKSDSGRRGRWGIGKFVFPRASLGSSFIGWTRRNTDQKSLLLGRSILKSHATDSGVHVPDGYYGHRVRIGSGHITAPCEDPAIIAAFQTTFRLQRTVESGLSLVVPWYDSGISKASLIDAAVRDWFYCLLCGDLEIEIIDPDGAVHLDQSTIADVVELLSEKQRADLDPLLALTRYAISANGTNPVCCTNPEQTNSPKWRDTMLDEVSISKLRRVLDASVPVAVRVPIIVRGKQTTEVSSYFDVYLTRDSEYESGRPVFVREGIVVSDAKGTSARGFRSLVVATHKPLADLLGDAENPAHTEWRQDTGNFKEKYKYGKAYLDFVRDSVRNIVRMLESDAEDSAPDLLIDFFSVPDESLETRHIKPVPKTGKSGDQPEPPFDPPPARLRRYTLSKVRGGFALSRGPVGSSQPTEIEIKVAYDVRNGDPFNKYHTDDFQLLRDGIEAMPDVRGLKLLAYAANRIRWAITDPDFHVSIRGFDMNRDLIVNVIPIESGADAEAP